MMIREITPYLPLISELAEALRFRVKNSEFEMTEEERQLLTRSNVILCGHWVEEE